MADSKVVVSVRFDAEERTLLVLACERIWEAIEPFIENHKVEEAQLALMLAVSREFLRCEEAKDL